MPSPPSSHGLGEIARCTIFGESNTCILRAVPPGWMVPRGYHPSRGPSAPAPTWDALARAEMGGTGPAHRPAALPPKGGVAPRRRAGPPGPEPRRREAGGEPRRQAPEGGRSRGRAAARPPNRAQPNRQGREGTPEVGQATGRQARRRGVSPDHPHRRGAGGRPEPWRGGQAAAVRPQPHCCDEGRGPGRPTPACIPFVLWETPPVNGGEGPTDRAAGRAVRGPEAPEGPNARPAPPGPTWQMGHNRPPAPRG